MKRCGLVFFLKKNDKIDALNVKIKSVTHSFYIEEEKRNNQKSLKAIYFDEIAQHFVRSVQFFDEPKI